MIDLISTIDKQREVIDRLLAENAALLKENHVLEHQVITCGVAATNPDSNLTRSGVYAGKWNSAQAESVRKLRDERDTLRELVRETYHAIAAGMTEDWYERAEKALAC